MRALGLRNSLYVLLTAFFMLLLCFLLYYSSISMETRKRILLSPPTYNSKMLVLEQVLKRAAMSDRTVILTIVDESWASPDSVLGLFLQSFKLGEGTQRLLNHLVIITTDAPAFEYCKSLHPHCICPSIFAHYFPTISINYKRPLSWKRNDILLDVTELGYNIIFTNADVLWLRSPLIHLNPNYELTISCNFSSNHQRAHRPEGGLFFLKANAVAIDFFKHLKLSSVLFPDSQAKESSMCDSIMESQEAIQGYRVRIQHVDTTYFGGFCQLNKDNMEKAVTMNGNCCEDLRNKVHDLKLALEDWMYFRKHLSEKNTSEPMHLRWRAPQKCMGL